jgi:hypothetical protein
MSQWIAPKGAGVAGSVGAPVKSTRDNLLERAGITEEAQTEAVRKAWNRKLELLEARKTQFFSFEGRVTDQRDVADNALRLQAADCLDRFLGVVAPRSTQKIEVVHRLEYPEYALPDGAPVGQVVDVTEVKEVVSNDKSNP